MKYYLKVLSDRSKIIFANGLYFVLMRLNDAFIAIENLFKKSKKTQNYFLILDMENTPDVKEKIFSKINKLQKNSNRNFIFPVEEPESYLNQFSEKAEDCQRNSFRLFHGGKNR